MQTFDTVEIEAAMTADFHSQLQQFAIDHNIVTAETGIPNIASAIHEILDSIVSVGESDEDQRFVGMCLGFSTREEGEVPKPASTIIAIVGTVLEIHRYPGMKKLRKVTRCTTLEFLNLMVESFLLIYPIFQEKSGYHSIVDFIKETEKVEEDSLDEFLSFYSEFCDLAIREYLDNKGDLSIKDK